MSGRCPECTQSHDVDTLKSEVERLKQEMEAEKERVCRVDNEAIVLRAATERLTRENSNLLADLKGRTDDWVARMREAEELRGKLEAAERERDEARAEIEALKDERALARMDAEIDGDAEANALLERAQLLLAHEREDDCAGCELAQDIRVHLDRVKEGR